jgi:hypothetical protein
VQPPIDSWNRWDELLSDAESSQSMRRPRIDKGILVRYDDVLAAVPSRCVGWE